MMDFPSMSWDDITYSSEYYKQLNETSVSYGHISLDTDTYSYCRKGVWYVSQRLLD